MGSFSIWHWLIVLLVVLLLFGARIKLLATMQFPALIFAAGALTSTILVLIGLTSRAGDLPGAWDMLTSDLDIYVPTIAAAGLTWAALGYGIRRLGPPSGAAGWLVYSLGVTLLTSPVALALTILLRMALFGMPPPPSPYLEDPRSWFGYLDTFPYNLMAFVRAVILVGLMTRLKDWGISPSSSDPGRWPPVPISRCGPDESTRILCGNALLAGAAFRRSVLAFFQEKWTATAPEFGLDIRLLANVCSYAGAQAKTYNLVLAAVAVFGAIMIAAAPAIGLPLAILIAGCVWFVKWRKEQTVARMFGQVSFDRMLAAEKFANQMDRKLVAALPQEDQNLIVYRGFTPFVGAGLDLGGWSFVTFVDKPKIKDAQDTVRPFTVPELYLALDAAISGLKLPRLRCRDYFFVRGLDIKRDPTILADPADRPQQFISPELGALYMEEQDARIRNYKCIQVIGWGGEIIVSYFLRCSLQGTSLLVEMKRYLLPPLAGEHRRVDRLGRDGLALRIGQIVASLLIGPIVALVSPFIVLTGLQEAIAKALVSDRRRARRRRRAAENDPSYDYGADATLRARFAQNAFLHYFQKSDADFDNKLIERKILDEIERFLDENGIDTTDIRDRQTTILNSGILVQGGDVRAESLAVGQGAQAIKAEGHKPVETRRSKETVE
jgi:hypothetical protein